MWLHTHWVLDLKVPRNVGSIREGGRDFLRWEWRASQLRICVIPQMSLGKQKFCVVGPVILLNSEREREGGVGLWRWLSRRCELETVIAPFRRQWSALHCTVRLECGDESPPGPAEAGDASSLPRWRNGCPPSCRSWNACSGPQLWCPGGRQEEEGLYESGRRVSCDRDTFPITYRYESV